jgi:DNA-directed RNA polymerase specialized sigma24 family protein
MSNFFDLDISFEEDDDAVISKIPAQKLLDAIETLPKSLKDVALGIFYQRRTFSDVSQDLGIRQSELVARLHRAQLAISMYLMKSS